jgi:predicted dithiol-disulfide oxidoreductase (DUF899 family)
MATQSQHSIEEELGRAEEELGRCQEKIAQLRKQLAQPVVQDYTFTGPDKAQVALSSLFGAKEDLIAIHNMGASCAYCTMWADGFNGLLPHLEDRAAFVVISPDDATTQQRFAQQRDWKFTMVSSNGTTFRADMGYQSGEYVLPGVSVFHKNADGSITHVSHAPFGPGDAYCSAWHLFDLLPKGSDEWEPKFKY